MPLEWSSVAMFIFWLVGVACIGALATVAVWIGFSKKKPYVVLSDGKWFYIILESTDRYLLDSNKWILKDSQEIVEVVENK